MKLSRHYKKTNNIFRIILIISATLVTAFVVFLLIGKFYSTPAKEVSEKNNKLVEASQQVKKSEEPPEPKKEKTPDGKPLGKVVYLTFDDGPSNLTGQFLDILKEQNIKATFFMQGINLQKKNLQEYVKRADKEGHYIGAHSMTHDSQKLYHQGQFLPEMKETLSIIHQILGKNPKLIRAPYGSAPNLKSQEKRDQIVEAGWKMWDWTIDSNDWRLKKNDEPNKILENIKTATTADVEIVLMHEKVKTLQELPEIIKFFKEKGYRFEVYNEAEHFQNNFAKDPRL